MIKYDMLPERIDIDIKGNIYVQKLPMERRIGLLCPYAEESSTVCNIRCAKCSITLEDMQMSDPASITKSYWTVTCCGAVHHAKRIYRQTQSCCRVKHGEPSEMLYREVVQQYD